MESRITSARNPRVKTTLKLRSRRGRDKQGRMVVDGTAEISRALAAGAELVELFVCDELLSAEATQIRDQAVRLKVPLLVTTPAVFSKVAFGDRQDGVVAVLRTPQHTLERLELPSNPVIAVLERLEKPGNVGAIVRSADAAGIAAVIVADGVSDLYNPNAIRSSLGTVFTTPLVAATSTETLDWLRREGFRILAARVGASTKYTDVDYRGAIALVFGSESAGVSSLWSSAEISAVSLPMLGAADSLNVAATASVLFYEALRQRTCKNEPS